MEVSVFHAIELLLVIKENLRGWFPENISPKLCNLPKGKHMVTNDLKRKYDTPKVFSSSSSSNMAVSQIEVGQAYLKSASDNIPAAHWVADKGMLDSGKERRPIPSENTASIQML